MIRSLWFALFIMMAGALPACGSYGAYAYLGTVTLGATADVAAAKSAGAERHAPYEYWTAITYLHMAREKATYADYQLAIGYGERSSKAAKDAVTIASKTSADGPSGERDTHAPAEVITSPGTDEGNK